MTVELYCGDCLDIMPTLPPQSIDAIITDLPYGTTACRWDEIIPFEPMWREVKRLLKPRGVFVTTASQPFTSKLICSNIDWFKTEVIWRKNTTGDHMNAKNKVIKMHENIAVFSAGTTANCSGNRMTYNPQGLRNTSKRRPGVYQGKYGKELNVIRKSHHEYKQALENYPISILEFTQDPDRFHPTQKPVELYEYLILTYTNAGDTVLDICAGSGTTGVAAILTKRNAILIEKDAAYFEIMQKRIHDAQQQMPLPLDLEI